MKFLFILCFSFVFEVLWAAWKAGRGGMTSQSLMKMGGGAMLQAGRSPFRFSMGSLIFFF
jgi:hypothetical protein